MNIPNLTTIFIIEDDDVDFKLLERAFKKRKMINPTIRAKDGQEALEILESGRLTGPFITLLDLNMPRMNGREFLSWIRGNKKFSRSIVFVLTTSSDEEDICHSFDNHVAGYFLKDSPNKSIDSVVDIIDAYWQLVVMPKG